MFVYQRVRSSECSIISLVLPFRCLWLCFLRARKKKTCTCPPSKISQNRRPSRGGLLWVPNNNIHQHTSSGCEIPHQMINIINIHIIYTYIYIYDIWVNYHISLTWNKAILGMIPTLVTMIPLGRTGFGPYWSPETSEEWCFGVPFIESQVATLWWTNIAMENGYRNSGFSH